MESEGGGLISLTIRRALIGAARTLRHQVRYALPLWTVTLSTAWLPDNRLSIRVRGALARPFIRQCGPGFQLGRDVTLLNTDRLCIGRDVYIAKGAWLNALGGLKIGEEVVISPYVIMSTLRHEFADGSVRFGGSSSGGIEIGAGTWIASHVSVAMGVRVGSGCLVGANAVVNTAVPDGTFAAGVPAVVVGPRPSRAGEVRRRADLP